MNYRDFIQKLIYRLIDPLLRKMLHIGITPNIVTAIGFVGNFIAAACFVYASNVPSACSSFISWGGIIILSAGLFDMMDGRLARLGNLSSDFGALWDSTLDRYSELMTLFGISLVFLSYGWTWMGIVTYAAITGSIIVSYVRARAEGLRIECKVGLMQRPERVVVTAIGAIITGCTQNLVWLAGAMTLIAVLANITACWRIWHCWKKLKK